MRIVAIDNGCAALANMYAVPFTARAQEDMENCYRVGLWVKIWRWTP